MSNRPTPDPFASLRTEEFKHWEAWVGVVGGIFYARRRTSPPVVVRAATVEELATKIREHEGGEQQ